MRATLHPALPLLADAFQQHSRRFVGGVLSDELAGKRLFQDRLAERFAALQRGVDLPLVLLDHRELLVEQPFEWDGVDLVEVGYGWRDPDALLAACAAVKSTTQ